MLDIELKRIAQSEKEPPQRFLPLYHGYLEKIINDTKRPARGGLLWQNCFFGKRIRKIAKLRTGITAGNSPLSLHPHILDEVRKYVYLPKEVIVEYRKKP